MVEVLKIFTSPDDHQRVYIVRRPDGAYSFLQQWKSDPTKVISGTPAWTQGFEPEDGWNPPSSSIGIYDSAETAEWEALCKVEWMSLVSKPN